MAIAKKRARSGANAPAQAAAMAPETLHRAFRDMLLLRRFEEKASQLYGMGLIGGFCHLYIGQEAVVTGVQYALEPGDSVITGYRCHAHMLIAGVPPKGGHGRAHRARRRRVQGQGRLDAPVRAGARLLRRPRHRRRPGAARRRPRLRPQVPRLGPDFRHLLRRRGGQSGPGVRGLQHGGALAAPRPLRDREQPVRHGHLGRALGGGLRPARAGCGLRHSRRAGRRNGRGRRVAGD